MFVESLTCLRNFLNHFKWESFSFFSSLSPSPQKLKCPPALPPFSLLEDFLGGLGESPDSTVEGWRVVSFDRGRKKGGRDQGRENNLFFSGLEALRERKKKALIPTTKLFVGTTATIFPRKEDRQT